MNYLKEAETYLKEYYDFRKALNSIKVELDGIEKELTSVKSTSYDGIPGGGSSSSDDRIVNLIFKKQVKEEAFVITEQKINHIDSILEQMGEDGIILRRCYIDGDMHFRIYNDLNLSERTFYSRKASAIRKFSIQLFGLKAVI